MKSTPDLEADERRVPSTTTNTTTTTTRGSGMEDGLMLKGEKEGDCEDCILSMTLDILHDM